MQKTEIKFGTDGFRGIIGKDFTYKNIERVINAISIYIKEKKTIILGYDPRKEAKDYADFCANLLKNNGFRVILSSKVTPTPIVAYNAKYYPNSIGAIMLTASHNPPEYQGIKFIPNYAGPATKEITDEILKYLDLKITPSNKGEIIEENLEEEYFKHLEKIIDFEAIKKGKKFIFDGLYSSSIGYFDEILKRKGVDFISFNMHHDPDFGGGLPEPKEKFLKHIEKGSITLANDGDADRYGVIDEDGKYVSPNIILALLLKYLVKKGKKGKMIKTVGVSNIVEVVAKKLNIETITTPVGFKWLSEEMRKNETILAGEDSGGLSTGNHIPEKDGIFANLLILEMLANENKTLSQMQKELYEFAQCEFFTDRVDIKLESDEKTKKILEQFNSISQIAGYDIKSKLELDGIKLFLDNSLSSLLIRKSGTEPLLRFYIESENIDKLNKIKDFIKNLF